MFLKKQAAIKKMSPWLMLNRSNVQIEELPNECLMIVFDYLPFKDLVYSVPLVSHRWCDVQKLVCKKKTVLLVNGDPDADIPAAIRKIFSKYVGLVLHSDLVASFVCRYTLREKQNDQPRDHNLIKRLFPSIEKLIMIQFRMCHNFESVCEMLALWPNLVTLKLICYEAKPLQREQVWREVSDRLNQLTRLRHLALFSRLPVDFAPNQLEMLSQLETLHLGQFHVDLTKLREVRKLSMYFMNSRQWLDQMEVMPLQVARQITELSLYPDQLELPYIDVVANRFTSLQYLHVRTRLSLKHLIYPLGALTKLKHLRIWHYKELGGNESTIANEDLATLPRLSCLEMFHLYIRLESHCQLAWINVLMPALKYIKFDRFRPICCFPADSDRYEEMSPLCEKAILAPLKQCAQLRLIYLDRKPLVEVENPLESLTTYDHLEPDQL